MPPRWIQGLEAIGLVGEPVEPGAAFDRAPADAERIVEGPSLALSAIKMMLDACPAGDPRAALDRESSTGPACSTRRTPPKA